MKLVSKFSTIAEAEGVSDLLESNGIATFVSSKRSLRLGSYFTGAFHVGLWPVFDSQHWDAVQLLNNPNHEVSVKLTRTEMTDVQNSIRKKDMSDTLKFLFQLLAVAIVFALIVAKVVNA